MPEKTVGSVPVPASVDPNPDRALLGSLADRIDDGLRDVLGGARDVALVNFPNHNNPGDSAIWLGARAALRRIGVRVRYQCAWCTYSPGALRRALPDGPVLINGGGNFGDLYAGQQGLRERLLAELTGRRIVQLPQSIHFRERANLDRVRRLVAGHGGVTLIAREQRSKQLAQKEFDADVRLLPDMALALRELPRPPSPAAVATARARRDRSSRARARRARRSRSLR
jgi:pyruvyl transferase EpsO